MDKTIERLWSRSMPVPPSGKRARRWYLIKDAEQETTGNAYQTDPAVSATLSGQGEFHVAPLAALPSE